MEQFKFEMVRNSDGDDKSSLVLSAKCDNIYHVLQRMDEFLKGCGFVYDGYLDIILPFNNILPTKTYLTPKPTKDTSEPKDISENANKAAQSVVDDIFYSLEEEMQKIFNPPKMKDIKTSHNCSDCKKKKGGNNGDNCDGSGTV